MRIRIVDDAGKLFVCAREAEAEQLLKAGLAKPQGRGSKIRCLSLICSRKRAWTFLRGARPYGSPSKTFKIERVGDQRRAIFQHDFQRCLSFRPELEVTQSQLEDTINQIDSIDEPVAICEQSPVVDESFAVHSERREEVAGGKETERAADEPTTLLDVAVPAKQPQHIMVPLDQREMHGVRKLAAAVLVRAFEDAKHDSQARRWFEVTPQPMLKFWCELAQVDQARVRRQALSKAMAVRT